MQISSKLSIILGVAVLLSSGNAQSPTPSPDFDCPSFDDSIHPDPRDCSMYFVCTNGLAWHESCPPGLLFDPTILECNWPHLVQCAGSGPTTTVRTTVPPSPTTTAAPPSSGPTNPPPSTTQGPTDETDQPSTTPAPTTSAPISTTSPPEGFECPTLDGTFPHPADCNAYYVCEGGVPSVAHCPPGLHYDPILQVCNWPEDAGCQVPRLIFKKH
ncbi:peritrophin-1 [Folsomia candida]|uniref:Peritrophin-1 n=1 Tax=Folsomia candida TaxID=158441 RepID=A0A226EQK5_FOLCA|nr:peritrophin-1 [Folsomia candida]OXA59101.1 Peritrophin-1 [Folsomia candida]